MSIKWVSTIGDLKVIPQDFIPRGVLWITSDGDDRKIFLGLKFSNFRIFWVGKFGKNFIGWLDVSRDFFLGIQNNLKIHGSARATNKNSISNLFFMLYHLMLSGKFYGWENQHGISLRVNFWSRDFCGFWFLPPFDHPHHLKSRVPLPLPPCWGLVHVVQTLELKRLINLLFLNSMSKQPASSSSLQVQYHPMYISFKIQFL